ncbi:ATPase, dynein-related, AAA domain containing protein [uncultured Caudovirales phage]|uniref:ATPase, dynein-related, AAA domain containing protein n=1 Tax=uncultured Caudovirales phage TaxID=2100421 RepID=A0A6J5L1Y0_9CAUD|nr:ATPase, dynein-related, AAA domain containing protein [uncultured Caudovirales phage]
MSKQETFFAKAIEIYPLAQDSGILTRQEVLYVCERLNIKYMPSWLMAAKVGRGLYSIKPTTKLSDFKVSIPKGGDSLVPEIDPNFVPFGNFKDLESIIKSGIFYPSYIYGPTGNGKSTMIEQICAKHKKPLIRVNLNMMTDEEQLIGSKTLRDGNVEVVEGPVLVAMRGGYTLMCLEQNEEIKVGTLRNNTNIKLRDMEIGKEYPVISYNLETSEFEDDIGVLMAESERDDLFIIEFDDGTSITMTSDHPVIVDGNYENSISEGLSIGDWVVSL